jgi:hypothetical protein
MSQITHGIFVLDPSRETWYEVTRTRSEQVQLSLRNNFKINFLDNTISIGIKWSSDQALLSAVSKNKYYNKLA